MSSSTPLLVIYIVIFVGVCIFAISYIISSKEQPSTAPVSHTTSSPPPGENTIPFSYNVPVDSHMNYEKDVVIVIEHPDDKIAVGMPAR